MLKNNIKATRPLTEQNITILASTAYLAPIEYYIAIAKADNVVMEYQEMYEKQSYRNRCCIAAANGKMGMSIPVEKAPGDRLLTKDVRISKHSDWQIQHWRSIESAYNSSPFFEYYKDDFMPFYKKEWEYLWDFNQQIQFKVLELLNLNVNLALTNEYTPVPDKNVLDLRSSIHPKKENVVGIFKPYYQVFEQKLGFIPNLSIIDLLFNMGNESQLIIHNL